MKPQRAYTLIEVLISASIFAAVLIGSFAVFSTINRANDIDSSSRDLSYAGYSFVEALAELARYATPSRFPDGALACTGSIPGGADVSVFPAYVCQTGLYYDETNRKLGLNILDTAQTVPGYVVYQISLNPHTGLKQVTRGTTKYNVYDLSLIKYRNFTSGFKASDPVYYQLGEPTITELVPNGVVVMVPDDLVANPTRKPFAISLTSPVSTDAVKGGSLSLDLANAQEVPAKILSINLLFADVNELAANPNSAVVFPFKTAVATRSFISSFAE